jgi:hypothetical protein
MSSWDAIRRNHQRLSEGFPTRSEGLRAIDLLACILEHGNREELAYDHPLRNRFVVGAEFNYQWFVQYARKLVTASRLRGSEEVTKRLSEPKEFFGANNEIETALKLHLEGLKVSFVKRETIPTPDIVTTVRGQSLHAEVSSLNRPDYEAWHVLFMNHLLDSTFRNGIAAGGYLVAAKSWSKTEEAIRQIDEAIRRVKESDKTEKLNIPGIATVYLAPKDKSSELPADCRGQYRFTGPSIRPLQEQIIRKIEEKASQISAGGHSGILVLYSQTVGSESANELFEAPMDEVEVVLAAHPGILALFLVVPHMHIGVISTVKEDASEAKHNGNKMLLSSGVGLYQYESSLIWKNPHSDEALPDEILNAFEKYSDNLGGLLTLEDASTFPKA